MKTLKRFVYKDHQGTRPHISSCNIWAGNDDLRLTSTKLLLRKLRAMIPNGT